jgi:tryptophan 2,3-dioxygenase
MNTKTNSEEILEALEQKFDALNQKTETHLEGLLWSKPITYWDYIQTDALLNLQTQRTVLPDEMVFIMYHQVNELLFKMILWEINQLCHIDKPKTDFFTEKLRRISRYFDMLTTSFDIMGDGMEVEQYMKFRNTLTPASGFQSAQYRSTCWRQDLDGWHRGATFCIFYYGGCGCRSKCWTCDHCNDVQKCT